MIMGANNIVAKHGSWPYNIEPRPNHLWCPVPSILIYHHANAACTDKNMLGGHEHNQKRKEKITPVYKYRHEHEPVDRALFPF
jgi:hypothetical protein